MTPETRTAEFSPCRRYRYTLFIKWDDTKGRVMFIGLNPSTADETKDDPTVRRCKQFAKDWGYGSMVMTNLFAWRDTDPKKMLVAREPIGEMADILATDGNRYTNFNDLWLAVVARDCNLHIAAWGKHGSHLYRAVKVKRLVPNLHYLKLNKDGSPQHPLYLKGDLVPIAFQVPALYV